MKAKIRSADTSDSSDSSDDEGGGGGVNPLKRRAAAPRTTTRPNLSMRDDSKEREMEEMLREKARRDRKRQRLKHDAGAGAAVELKEAEESANAVRSNLQARPPLPPATLRVSHAGRRAQARAATNCARASRRPVTQGITGDQDRQATELQRLPIRLFAAWSGDSLCRWIEAMPCRATDDSVVRMLRDAAAASDHSLATMLSSVEGLCVAEYTPASGERTPCCPVVLSTWLFSLGPPPPSLPRSAPPSLASARGAHHPTRHPLAT